MKKKKKFRNPSKSQLLIGSVRQLAQPKEFRIQHAALSPEMLSLIEQLSHSLESAGPSAKESTQQTAAYEELMSFMINLLAQVGTGLWRLKQKMVKPDTEEPMDEMRRAFRHFESTWEALMQAGIEIQDHTGQPVPEGGVYALRAIAYEHVPGLIKEQVIETVKPSIYFRGQRIQMGDVVIGTPESRN
jgi:hypothetical protein